MTRREALAKATITTTDAAAGLLDPSQARAFIRTIKDSDPFGMAIRQEIRGTSSGEIDKIATGSRIIRAATENADDGYRAGATFATVPYQTTKVRLPWEVTEDVFHENIEGQELEATLTAEMTQQFGNDLSDLDINGDTAAVGGDAAFLNIDDGLLKQIAAANVAGRNIDGSAINAGALSKAHFFEGLYALPNKYRARGGLRWFMSPNRAVSWWEHLSDRNTAAGDQLLTGAGGSGDLQSAARGPLGVPILGGRSEDGTFTAGIPQWPDSVIVLAQPRNFVRVVSWQVRKRKVTGETDMELAARDKRFYVFFIKRDIVVEEMDAVVRIHTLDPIS
jgi:hypothetical protein